MNINKRPSYNDRKEINNLAYINQMNADKRPSYNTNYNVSNIILLVFQRVRVLLFFGWVLFCGWCIF